MIYAQRLLLLASALFAPGLASCISAAHREPAERANAQPHTASPQRSGNQITIIYDAFGNDSSMQKDWGFSALIEIGGKRILFDTGNDAEIFAHNVTAKEVDLGRLDFVIMSHRHGDHIGGLSYVLRVNSAVQIYAPKENFGVFGSSFPGTFYPRNESLPREMRYFDGEPPKTLRFGTPWPQANITWVAETTEVASGIHLILLKGSWGVDLDVMEISLAIDTPEGIVLVVGCGHPTIEKIVEGARQLTNRPIHLVVGGLHLLPAQDEETRRIATALHDRWMIEWIAPGHCTGEHAFEILKETFGNRYVYAGLGITITLGRGQVAGTAKQRPRLDTADLLWYRNLARSSEESADHRLADTGHDYMEH